MGDLDFERVREVFLTARDLAGAERRAALRRECGPDTALRAEVESLLAHHDVERRRATTPLVELFVGAPAELPEPPAPREPERLPRTFGRFELLEVIGRGGMGAVYRARQRTPDRAVAVKVIRPGMMSAAMLGRFRYEADVLARLQHPGIAQIFEAGTVPSGEAAGEASGGEDQPYFAMELVAGRPIDRCAADDGLAVRDRLDMIVKVCDAVHHAHQKGVIHRDLKPANILVDAHGQPKILDFGVAKLTDADVRTTTLRTGVGQLVGTLPYMSPEQVSGDAGRLDIRSDVYAIGVLAFELLTGRLPHDERDKTIADAALTIRDGAPTRLSAIAPALRGDLETITGKCLEKDPARRYESAAALANDLRRFLAHQPIVARPPSVRYQLRLFTRRHRALVAGGAVAVLALMLATVLSVGSAVRERRAADRAARQQLIAERTNEHLESILAISDPHRLGVELTVAEMLDRMVARLDGGEELPEVEARVRAAIGKTYLGQQRYQPAIEQLRRATDLGRGIDPKSRDLAYSLMKLGIAQSQAEVGDGGEAAYREAIGILEGTGDPLLAVVLSQFVHVLLKRSDFEEAEPIVERRLADARVQGDPVLIVASLRQLARIRKGLGAHDAALESVLEALALATRRLPETHPMRSSMLDDLARVHAARGDYEAAAEASRRAYDLVGRTRKAGAFDWETSVFVHLDMLDLLDREEEIVAVLTEARDAVAAERGADDPLAIELERRLADRSADAGGG